MDWSAAYEMPYWLVLIVGFFAGYGAQALVRDIITAVKS